MRIAFFAVLHPVRSGISDYCEHLLPELEKLIDVDVFIDDYSREDVSSRIRSEVFNYLRFEHMHKARRYDAIVYQMGNDLHHRFMYHYIFNFPGILVLHDFNLHPSRASMLRSTRDEATYTEELRACLGAGRGAEVARLILADRRFSPLLDIFPMNELALHKSRAAIVHNPYVKKAIEEAIPGTPAYLLNMGIPMHSEVPKKAQARGNLDLPLGKFIVLHPGFAGAHRKPEVALDGFARLLERHPNAILLFVGAPDPNVDIKAMIERRGLDRSVILKDYVTDRTFLMCIAAADVVLNLRNNKIRETSATMLTAMSLGRPVIATRLVHNCHLSPEICTFVEHSPTESEDLAAAMGRLWSNPKEGESIGSAAREYVRREHSIQQAAAGYKHVVAEVTSSPESATKRARSLHERISWLDEETNLIAGGLCGQDDSGTVADELRRAIEDLGLA
ncbi:MAG: glycosyltransferase [Candidatus Coatesbacteria bacterium]|nr:glycosyltransferase [Candidatus Coatesbacteria bacterium]